MHGCLLAHICRVSASTPLARILHILRQVCLSLCTKEEMSYLNCQIGSCFKSTRLTKAHTPSHMQANNAHIAILTNKPHSSAPLIQSNDRSAHKKGIPRSQSLPAQALGEGCEHTQQQPQSAAARQPARSCSVGDAIELTQSSKSPAVQPALPHTLQAAGSTIVRSSSSCTTTRVTTKVRGQEEH